MCASRVDRLLRGFVRRCEQRADLDVEAEIGEGGGDDLLAAVMAVLARSWRRACAARGRRSPRRPAIMPLHARRRLRLSRPPRAVDAGDGADLGAVAVEDLLQSASEISPTVALARAASMASASRLPSRRAPLGQRGERCVHRLRHRARRCRRCSFSICCARTAALSTLSTSIGCLVARLILVDADDGLLRRYRCAPACVAAASSMRSLGCPPRWPSPCRRASRPPRYALQARCARSPVSRST